MSGGTGTAADYSPIQHALPPATLPEMNYSCTHSNGASMASAGSGSHPSGVIGP